MDREQYKIMFWGLFILGVPAYLFMKRELESTKNELVIVKNASLGVRS